MKNEAVKIFQKKRKQILETWMKLQLSDDSLREDLISNEDLRNQSEELVNVFIDNLNDESIDDPQSSRFEPVVDILAGISISRARQGFSPRETGVYIFSLKDSLISALQQEIKDPQELYLQTIKINKVIDSFGVTTFETFIKAPVSVFRFAKR
jgi:rsbT co-antagonist protein RsbR